MLAIVGIVVVFGAVLGGYLMEKGHLMVLLQPAELLIIAGAGAGTILVANPPRIVKEIIAGLIGILKGSSYSKARYVDSLKMLYELLNKARRQGLVALESDIEEPDKSPIFTKYKAFTSDYHARDFLCDTMRMAVTGGVDPFDVDQMMDLDMEVHHGEISQPGLRAEYGGRLIAGPGHRGGGAGCRHHDGRARWSPGRNRAQGCSRTRRHLPGYPALLWDGRAAGSEHGEICR